MAEHDLFEAEESALRAAADTHALDSLDARSYRDALGTLITQFRRQVREARRVIMHSDRQERELNILNARLTQLAAELDYKAKHDSLTGAYNRRAVIELAEAHLRDGALALIVLDIDNFKRINDEHGHPAGDAVIVELVARLRAVAPEPVEIGRVGGEEFTVVLPGMELEAAVALAERMRAQVASSPFDIPAGRIVTASFGVSFTPCGGMFTEAYGRADAALYEAKRRGRNSVAS
ncbi:GGDEF domain-containing protein [Rhodanobacter sp. PCA2]|uniref:GGDEF domain-containing protein n=1 Tax=Rhodanobacter sp. PCA2 TaxID=2006117 RepID=UPI0015E7BD88|nr:GGDEF domain-containing protein [Rhodanobacter sp. PCA2]MBA2077041.1 GGDEF domain-containing protein [Rhodanobacter sp. PCA2]